MAALTNLLRSEFDAAADLMRFDFEDDEGYEHHIPIGGAVAGMLLLSLVDRLRERSLAHSGRSTEEQPLQFVDASALSFESGKVGLLLQLESNIRFSLVLNAQGVSRLRAALSSCDDLLKPRGSAH